VAQGAALLGAILFALALALYLRYIRYDRVAARHVPQGAVIALRLDVEQALLYEPARRHLLPLLGSATAPASQGDARLQRIEDRTGLRRGDLREIVVAIFPGEDDWVVALGGIFPSSPGAPSLALALASEGQDWALSSDTRVTTGPGGVAAGRAADGAVLVASSEAMLRKALPADGPPSDLHLARVGPGGFAFNSRGLAELAGVTAGANDADAVRARATEVTGVVDLGERLTATTSVVFPSGTSAVPLMNAALEWLRVYGRTEGTPGAGLIRVGVERSTVEAVGPTTARVQLVWEREEVDRAFALAAEAIRDKFGGISAASVLTHP
jgi:hypothetical protein